eukprot:bmy_11372T0
MIGSPPGARSCMAPSADSPRETPMGRRPQQPRKERGSFSASEAASSQGLQGKTGTVEATAVVPIFHLIELKRAFWLLFKWWWLGSGEVGWMTQRENFGADLGVGDGVEQVPPVGLVKDQVPQDLSIDVAILQQDVSAEGLHDTPVGGVSWLDDCGMKRSLGHSLEPPAQPGDSE